MYRWLKLKSCGQSQSSTANFCFKQIAVLHKNTWHPSTSDPVVDKKHAGNTAALALKPRTLQLRTNAGNGCKWFWYGWKLVSQAPQQYWNHGDSDVWIFGTFTWNPATTTVQDLLQCLASGDPIPPPISLASPFTVPLALPVLTLSKSVNDSFIQQREDNLQPTKLQS